MQTREQVQPFLLGIMKFPRKFNGKNLEKSAETLGGAAETVEKPKLNSSCEAEKNHCTKNELNLLSKNSIGKYDVILN